MTLCDSFATKSAIDTPDTQPVSQAGSATEVCIGI